MSAFTDCTVAVLTAGGRGAVSSIAVSGSAATELIERHFEAQSKSQLNRSLAESPLLRVVFGHWRRDGTVEEVVVCRKCETYCEVHCHGGRAAAGAIVADLVALGAKEISWQQWIHGQATDEIQAEALCALSEAPTQRCAGVLLDQYHGALRRAFAKVEHLLRDEGTEQASKLLESLRRRGHLGLHLTRPFRVALLGPPNVGKSSLLNRLLGFQRSIVFDQPGTTRDVVSAITALDGWPVELLDTAGLRETTDQLEATGAARARRTAEDADLVLYVVEPSIANLTFGETGQKVLYVLNKIDQMASDDQVPSGLLPTCALTGEGAARLVNAIVQKLVPDSPNDGDAVPFTVRQMNIIEDWICKLGKTKRN